MIDALRAAVRPWEEGLQVSFWNQGLKRSGRIDRGGIPVGTLTVPKMGSLADALRDYAAEHVGPKDRQPLLLSYSVHRNPEEGGHANGQCAAVTGMILDCDKGDDATALLEALRTAGLAFLFSLKHTKKFHVVVPIVRREVDHSHLSNYTRMHQAVFAHAIEAFEKIGGVRLDPAMASGLMRIEYPAVRSRDSDPLPVIDAAEGGLLDLEAFAKATSFRPPTLSLLPSVDLTDADLSMRIDLRDVQRMREDAIEELKKIRRTPATSARQGIDLPRAVEDLLAGRPFPSGQRDQTVMDLTNVIGRAAPDACPNDDDLDAVFGPLFRRTLAAMAAASSDAPGMDKVRYGIRRGQVFAREERARKERLQALVKSGQWTKALGATRVV